MVDNNQDQTNKQQQDQNQLSDEDLNDVNGGFGIPDFIENAAEKVGNKVKNTYDDVKDSYDAAKDAGYL